MRWAVRQRFKIALSVVAVMLGSGVILLLALDRLYPVPTDKLQTPSVQVTAADGGILRVFTNEQGNYQLLVDTKNISANYLETLLVYEDRQFYRHPGFNPFSMIRALWQWWHFGRVVSGGSTLTMQTARLIELHPRTCIGKFRQLFRAVQLELHYSKQQILALYLNHAPFGGNLVGVEAAAYSWFGKSARKLTDAEAALLVVLPQAPSRFRPDRFPQQALLARDKVLARMSMAGCWTEERTQRAKGEPLPRVRQQFPCHAAWLSRQLSQAYPDSKQITTTLDIDIQDALERFTSLSLSELPDATQLGVLIASNKNANVVACGSFNRNDQLAQADRVRTICSPGSTLKPFIYGMAIDDGLVHSATLLADLPWDFDGYRPVNFSGGFYGAVTLADALKLSLNVPAVQVLEQLKPRIFLERLQTAGIELKSDEPGLSLALGAGGINLDSLVRMYLALAKEGHCTTLRYRPDQLQQEKQLLSSASAWIIRTLLEDIGIPGRADLDGQKRIAWKSGTSYGHRDVWAIGVGSEYTVGISIGRADGSPQSALTGPETAGGILFDIFDLLPSSQHEYRHPKPDNVQLAEICWPSGRCCVTKKQKCGEVKTAWLVDSRAPATPPAIMERFSAFGDQHLNILSPRCGMKVAVGRHSLPLMTQGGQGVVSWYCNGHLLAKPELDLSDMDRGNYKLTAVDAEGEHVSVAIQLL